MSRKKKHSAEVDIELSRNPDKNGDDMAYLWVESTSSIFTNQGGGGSWDAKLELGLDSTVVRDTTSSQNSKSILATAAYRPFDPYDEITSRVIITTTVTLPSVADRFENLWEQFKNSFEQFWNNLQGGQVGDAFKQAVETWLGGQIQTLQLLTERRHAKVDVKNNVTKWKLLNLEALNRLIHRQSGFQPQQGTHGVQPIEPPPKPSRTTRRAVEDAIIERVDPEQPKELPHQPNKQESERTLKVEKHTKFLIETEVSSE